MKKSLVIMLIAVLALGAVFTLSACDDKEEDGLVTIERFVLNDLEVTEESALDLSKAMIVCYKSDGTNVQVMNNLTYDKSDIESKLNEDGTLKSNSAGTYEIEVYHLGVHIGALKVIVNVKR